MYKPILIVLLCVMAMPALAQDIWLGFNNDTNDTIVEFSITEHGQAEEPNLLTQPYGPSTVFVNPSGYHSTTTYDLKAVTNTGRQYIWEDRYFACGNLCTWTPRLSQFPTMIDLGPGPTHPNTNGDDCDDESCSTSDGGSRLTKYAAGVLALFILWIAVRSKKRDP